MKPEYKEYILNDEDGLEKTVDEQHFCPVCDKPTVIYHQEFYKDKGEVCADIYVDGALFISPDSKCEVIYIIDEYSDMEENIFFTPEELGLRINPFEKIIETFFCEYQQKYGITNGNVPYFCSKECARMFLLRKLREVEK